MRMRKGKINSYPVSSIVVRIMGQVDSYRLLWLNEKYIMARMILGQGIVQCKLGHHKVYPLSTRWRCEIYKIH